MKVVQMLYSYLISANQFSLDTLAESPTKEKRFAHSLYMDMLVLMVKIAQQIERRGGHRPLYETRWIQRITSDEMLKSHMMRSAHDFQLQPMVTPFVEAIKDSALYKRFLKNENSGEAMATDGIWKEIFDIIIAPDTRLAALLRQREDYTLRGVEKMRDMIDDTFSRFYGASDNLTEALKVLKLSMEKSRELYMRMLLLPVELVRLREHDIEEARHKLLPTFEERNPNLRFIENQYVAALSSDDTLMDYASSHSINLFTEDFASLRALLRDIMHSDLYKEYMEFPVTDFDRDCEFWKSVYNDIIFSNPHFLEGLEEQSVYWNDDVEILGTFVIKTLRNFQQGKAHPVLPMYKDEEDARFGADLFSLVVRNHDSYRRTIDTAIDRKKWDTERLAYMDLVIVMTALAEILNFPKIPLKVSFNEYIEIAKSYSMPKSGHFVNGMLRAVLQYLESEGVTIKRDLPDPRKK